MRSFCVGLAFLAAATAVACGAPSEDASSSTAAVNENADGGVTLDADVSIDAGGETPTTDAGDGGTPIVTPPLPPPLLGSIDPTALVLDGTHRTVEYTPDAPFTAFEVHATANTAVRILVDSRTRGAVPLVWLTDSTFRAVATGTTGAGSAYVRYDVPETGTYYLLLRNATNAPASFELTADDEVVVSP